MKKTEVIQIDGRDMTIEYQVFEPNTIVRCIEPVMRKTLQLKENDRLLYLGEIKNMTGHCAFVLPDGRIKFGWHTDNFEEIPKDEL